MSRSRQADVLFIGVGSHAVALQMSSGTELWRTKLKMSTYVTIHREGDKLFAGAGGEVYCLDPLSGHILWQNELKGLGLGLVAFAGSSDQAAQVAAVSAASASM